MAKKARTGHDGHHAHQDSERAMAKNTAAEARAKAAGTSHGHGHGSMFHVKHGVPCVG
ncbi:hypothetical protein AB0D45_06530 [Streptomyces sp. NPDC048352]|uniref:hypothetical protein n=1 Tax=Streptomyces sp. NPDC048352 TaxID=3154718 RepID=UPI00343C5FF9